MRRFWKFTGWALAVATGISAVMAGIEGPFGGDWFMTSMICLIVGGTILGGAYEI